MENLAHADRSPPPWLMLLIARFVGERWRKSAPADWRNGAAWLCLIAIYFVLCLSLGEPILDRGSAVAIWFLFTASGVATVFAAVFWARLVPTRVSLIIAVISWPALVWWALRCSL
jgi:hypothetical protein